MDKTQAYSNKAEHYARNRWDYAADAVRAIVEISRVTSSSCVADIGAGTGILTRHLAPLVGRIYAVEPNSAMRQQAESVLSGFRSCVLCDGTAEETGLADGSVDLITAAQAIHWFDPDPTVKEFTRILRPGGWLAIIRNTQKADMLAAAYGQLMKEELGVKMGVRQQWHKIVPTEFFFGAGSWQRLTFPFTVTDGWDRFFGSLLSTAGTPEENDPLFHKFEEAARSAFDRLSSDDKLTISGETELYIGQPNHFAI